MRLVTALRRAIKLPIPDDPAVGSAFGGGYYVGKMSYGGPLYWLILADKVREANLAFAAISSNIPRSLYDGKQNTPLLPASAAKSYAIDYIDAEGNNDYYIGAFFEHELAYRILKPTLSVTNVAARSVGQLFGANAQSVPEGFLYDSSNAPVQTTVRLFQDGRAQQLFANGSTYFGTSSHSSNSTGTSGYTLVRMDDGFTTAADTINNRYVRPFRRILIPNQ